MANKATHAVDIIREVIAKIRTNLQDFAESVTSKGLNVAIPLTEDVIKTKSMMAKPQAIFQATVSMALSTLFMTTTLFATILQIVMNLVLIPMAIMIIPMWFFPWTIPVAIAMSILYTLIMVVYVLTSDFYFGLLDVFEINDNQHQRVLVNIL